MDDETKAPARSGCLVCNKEGALALFGIAIGLLFVFMGVDIIRRGRMAASSVEGEVTSDD